MTFSRRSFLTATGGLAATATLAACGNNSGRPAASAASSASAGGPKPALKQWYHEYGEQGVQEAVKGYAKAYDKADVTVKWNPGDYDKLIPTTLLTANVPDVFEYGNGPTLDMIKAGQVVDLTDVVGDTSLFNQPIIKRLTYQGKLWAIPQTIDMQLLYYRPSLLQKAGVQPPTTFAQLVDVANKLKTKDMAGFFAGNDGGLAVLGNLFIWASGHEQLNADQTDVAFNDTAFHDAISAYREFFTSGAVLKSASADWYDASAFVNGETALQWGGLWSLTDIKEAYGDDVGVLKFPAMGSSGRPVVPYGAYSSCVAAKGSNVDASKAFVKWLWVDQEDKQVDFSNSYGTHIPAKPALAPRCDKLATGPGAEAAKFVAESGVANELLWTSALGAAYSAALSRCILKGADPKKEFTAVASQAKTELARAKG